MQFTNSWLPWLQTITGVTSNYIAKTSDSIDQNTNTYKSSAVTQTGPTMTLSINNQNMGFVKMLMNNHTVNVIWQNANGRTRSTPDITYSMYLKMTVAPNLSMEMFNNFSLLNSTFTKYNGTLALKMIF
jgi:hypothetical protein